MTVEQRKLVEDNHNLIFHYIHTKLNHNIEDWYGVLAIGLCKAAIHYDPSSDTKFSTYVGVVFDNEVKMQYRRNSNDARKINNNILSLQSPIPYQKEGDHDVTLEDTIEDTTIDIEGEVISRVELKNLIDSIKNPKYKSILSLYLLGYSQKEIGKQLGMSQSYVSRIMTKLTQRYRESLCLE